MDNVFIYWDNSNIFHEAQRFAESSNDGPDARYRVRINFDNMYRLAHADRPVKHAVAAGSVPPEMRQLWNRMENLGVDVNLFDRGDPQRGEQEMPDRVLQLSNARGCFGLQRRSWDSGITHWRRRGLCRRFRIPQHAGTYEATKLANRDPIVGALLQSSNETVGPTKRCVCAARRLLRVNHLHSPISRRVSIRCTPLLGGSGLGAAGKGVTSRSRQHAHHRHRHHANPRRHPTLRSPTPNRLIHVRRIETPRIPPRKRSLPQRDPKTARPTRPHRPPNPPRIHPRTPRPPTPQMVLRTQRSWWEGDGAGRYLSKFPAVAA